MRKEKEYHRAIEMRRNGKTYSEILAMVPVAKSTLSLWLRSVQLARRQRHRISRKKILAQKKGAESRHNARVAEIEDLNASGIRDVHSLTQRELWLIGIALYWAEGSKQNSASVSAAVQFGNSDVRMVKVFIAWLRALKIDESNLYYELYVHDNRRSEAGAFCSWWARELAIPRKRLRRVYFKKDKPLTQRTNVGDLYHGLIRIRVLTSTPLNRKISGWISGIVAHCQIV